MFSFHTVNLLGGGDMDKDYWAHVAGEGESLRSHALTEHLSDVGCGAGGFAGS